ncbi:MAG: hypothetical protein M1826_007289 [Phylliscum demangeonii]|nr:MAG: hypothetical protein M1826_007289 [Phylliscum demangeonii]
MSPVVKNVVLLGGQGSLGTHVLEALVKSKKFTVTVVSRKESDAAFDASQKVIKIDYTLDSLAQAFEGQDAVVSTIGAGDQKLLVDAAVKAGVKRFIPSEFGSNTTNKQGQEMCPLYKPKVEVVEYLQSKSKEHPDFTWTAIMCGAFYGPSLPHLLRRVGEADEADGSACLDWCLRMGVGAIDLKKHTAIIWDDGNKRWSATNMATIGQSVVGVLTHLAETKNRYVRIQSFSASQNEVLAVLEHVSGKTWPRGHADALKEAAEGREKLAKGDWTGVYQTILGALMNSHVDCGCDLGKDGPLDNELLGLPEESLQQTTEAVFHEMNAE